MWRARVGAGWMDVEAADERNNIYTQQGGDEGREARRVPVLEHALHHVRVVVVGGDLPSSSWWLWWLFALVDQFKKTPQPIRPRASIPSHQQSTNQPPPLCALCPFSPGGTSARRAAGGSPGRPPAGGGARPRPSCRTRRPCTARSGRTGSAVFFLVCVCVVWGWFGV